MTHTIYEGGFADDRRREDADRSHALRVREAEAEQKAKADTIRQNRRANERAMRAPGTVAFHQQVLDDYDPARLRADVVATYQAAVDSVIDGNLSSAIATHLMAVLREVDEHSRADTALGNGAKPRRDLLATVSGHEAGRFPNGRLKGVEEHHGHDGQPIRSTSGDAFANYAQRVYFQAIAHAARQAADGA